MSTATRRLSKLSLHLAAVAALGTLMGAGGDEEGGRGCGSLFSQSPAPDMEGVYAVAYDDALLVEVTIGGAAYTAELGPQGGVVEIEHNGQPFTFDLDCAREEVVCPSEVWPTEVPAEHRDPNFPHQVHLLLPTLQCDGETKAPAPAECGQGTDNPDCEDVCDGEMVLMDTPVLGSISENGEHFDILLGGGIATNGINCALLGLSIASADLVTDQTDDSWTVESMDNGQIVAGYSGACLWIDDVNMDGQAEAAAVGATLKFTTGFTAQKL